MTEPIQKLPAVTKEQWMEVNPFNIQIVEEFLRESVQLSDYTLKQYNSALRQYFHWIKENANNKTAIEIKSRDYLMYQNFLTRRGISSSGVKFKRAAVSSLNGYILTYYEEEYPTFKNYITKKIANPEKAFVHKKEPLTIQEYHNLLSELEKRNKWQEAAYLAFSFSTGCRRNEAKALLKEVADYEMNIKEVDVKKPDGTIEKKISKSYFTHDIRCKGRGKTGSVRKLQFTEDAMRIIKKWLEVRGEDDCPYMFVTKRNGKMQQVGENTFNYWCNNIFEGIVGRRVHPHLFRESRATSLVLEDNKDIKVAQRLLGHASSETTEIYVIRQDSDASDEAFV